MRSNPLLALGCVRSDQYVVLVLVQLLIEVIPHCTIDFDDDLDTMLRCVGMCENNKKETIYCSKINSFVIFSFKIVINLQNE